MVLADSSRSGRMRRLMAAMVGGAVIAAGVLAGGVLPAHAAEASLSVTEAPRSGGDITVTGAGFDGTSGLGFGLYLSVREVGTSNLTYTVWIDDQNIDDPGSETPTASMTVDGDFTIAVPIPEYVDGVAYELYTRGAHGIPNATNSLVYPVEYAAAPVIATPTATGLSASPTEVAEGEPVQFTASVTPGAEGNVEFSTSLGVLGAASVSNGIATLSGVRLPVGTSEVTATFTPADSSLFVGSVGTASVTVSAAQPTFTPSIAVFLADGTTPYTAQPVYDNDVLVVRGSGFDPAGNIAPSGTRPPISAGNPAGTYVLFGSVLETWQPSAGAPSTARKAASQKWAMSATALNAVPSAYQSAVRNQWAEVDASGNFETTLTVTGFGSALTGGSWSVVTFPASGVINSAQELRVAVNYLGEEPEVPTPSDSPKLSTDLTGPLDPNVDNTVVVTGTGFTGSGAAYGTYVSVGDTAVWSGGSAYPANGWITTAWVMPSQITNGTFTTTLQIPAGTLNPANSYQVASSAAHGLSQTDRSLDAFAAVAVLDTAVEPTIRLSTDSVRQGGTVVVAGNGFAPGARAVVTVNSEPITLGTAHVAADGSFSVSGMIPRDFAAGPHTVVATVGAVSVSAPLLVTALTITNPDGPATTEPAEPVCVARSADAAWFSWDVKSSFRSYVSGPIANGSYSIDWAGGSGAFNTEETRGVVSFGGSATFSGHSGALDLVLSQPRVRVTGASTAQLIVDVNSAGYAGNPAVSSAGVVLATLSLPDGAVVGDTHVYNGASATLTADGATAFMGFYNAGDELDSVSFGFTLGAEVPCDATTSSELAATGGQDQSGALWVGVLMVGLGVIAVARRRLRATQ